VLALFECSTTTFRSPLSEQACLTILKKCFQPASLIFFSLFMLFFCFISLIKDRCPWPDIDKFMMKTIIIAKVY
jgi:hypothetical protein